MSDAPLARDTGYRVRYNAPLRRHEVRFLGELVAFIDEAAVPQELTPDFYGAMRQRFGRDNAARLCGSINMRRAR